MNQPATAVTPFDSTSYQDARANQLIRLANGHLIVKPLSEFGFDISLKQRSTRLVVTVDEFEKPVGNSNYFDTYTRTFQTNQIRKITLYGNRSDNDITNRSNFRATIYGYGGNDTLTGGNANDELFGGGGNDLLKGGKGSDRLSGQGGADKIHAGAGNDRVWGGSGNDSIYGDQGKDRLRGGAGSDSLNGGSHNDLIWGEAGKDRLLGKGGNDVLRGGQHNDQLNGGNGHDRLLGEAGNDGLLGWIGKDVIIGGKGSDRFLKQKGDQFRDAGKADVTFEFRNGGNEVRRVNGFFARFPAGNFKDYEIIAMDRGLELIQSTQRNNKLLKPSKGSPIEFTRHSGHSLAGGVAFNFNQREIVLLDGSFTNSNVDGSLHEEWTVQVTLHEIGHNTHTIANSFLRLSGWNNELGFWAHRASAKFARDYGSTNPYEDYASVFAAHFMDAGNLTFVGGPGAKAVQHKIKWLRNYLASL